MTLAPFDHQPGDGQGTPLVDRTDHQDQTATPNGATIHDQSEGRDGQTPQQGLGEGQEVDFGIHLWVVNPAREAFGATVWMRAVRDMAGDQGQVRALAPNDTPDETCQGVQVAREIPLCRREKLR